MTDVTEPAAMNKSWPIPLSDLVGRCVAPALRRQGFAVGEIVTHWDDIVGPEVAAHAEPIRMRWTRSNDPDGAEPATLVLRVEGPAAVEIQHLSGVIIERINRYLGWQAVGSLAVRQAPLQRRRGRPSRPEPDEKLAAVLASELTGITDDRLRAALGRLGAAVRGR
jgi:hypothetical protein